MLTFIMKRVRLLFPYLIFCLAIFCLAFFLWQRESTINELKDSHIIGINLRNSPSIDAHPTNPPIDGNLTKSSSKDEDEKLLTVVTSLMDETNRSFSEYRGHVQSNFLRMTQYPCFHKKVQFVILTNSKETRQLIARDYPRVLVMDTILRGGFKSPLYKDIVRSAMEISKSFFYMQANACGVYDNSLVLTLEAVKEAWRKGHMRQKILIYGQRYDVNINTNTMISNEVEFGELFQRSQIFRPDSHDYFIVTKETIDFDLYVEAIMGRGYHDPYNSNYAVHNEVENIDGSKSIRLLHQIIKNLDTHPMDVFYEEEAYNINLVKLRKDHYSTTCSRYSTEFSKDGQRVEIYDKKTDSMLNSTKGGENYFFIQHGYWVKYGEGDKSQASESSPSLVVVVLAFNKPDSLLRLLTSLSDADYHGDRIDLVISLDIGHMGYYDLPCLITTKRFEWKHGSKRVVLKDTHRGQMYQWIEASSIVDENTQLFIVEDCVVLSPHWYEYFKAVLRHSKERLPHEQIAGWSLEAPIGKYSQNFEPSQFFDSFAGKSSVVYSGIKPVRSFIPARGIWTDFVEWFMREHNNVANDQLSGSIISRLMNIGIHSDWEKNVWVTWFRYFLELHHPNHTDILYIFNKRGTLGVRVEMTLNWSSFAECYHLNKNQLLVTEFGLKMDELKDDDTILIPADVIPKYDLQSLL